MLTTFRSYLARAIVRLAIFAAPADQAARLAETTHPIWRPGK